MDYLIVYGFLISLLFVDKNVIDKKMCVTITSMILVLVKILSLNTSN